MLVALLVVLPALVAHGDPPATKPPDIDQMLIDAGHAMTTDHARYTALLDEIRANRSRLTPAQEQYLQFLDAVKADMGGDKATATRMYTEILAHVVDPRVAARARNSLIALYLLQRNYVKAYALASEAIEKLPHITDHKIKSTTLGTIIRALDSQKRYSEAIKYADQLENEATSDSDRCAGRVFRTQERIYRGETLADTREDYLQAIEYCKRANTPGFANGLREVWASQMTEEGHPDKAIAYLDHISPATLRSGSRQHIAGIYVVYAEAYLKKHVYDKARTYALKAVNENASGTFNWTLQYAYSFLYQIAKHDKQYALALTMYEKYMAQYKAAADDAQAQAIAYQIVKQDLLSNKMKLDELAKQNKILQLRQSLDSKSAETNRLYVLLLTFLLASIAFWAYRIKHSQIRFRRMARHDDLTGIYNRPYFFEKVDQTLERLRRTDKHACFMILDMDHFKRINDIYGHATGDDVLQHVARICQEELRESDLFGRLGGEEFGILMPVCTRAQAVEIGERIRHALALAPVTVRENERVTVTTSIGVACTETHGHAMRPLLIHADEALYEAKRSGRNRVVSSNEEPEPAAS